MFYMHVVLLVGGKRQWKHHPIYVQQEQHFQFFQRISPPLHTHTHSVCPLSPFPLTL